MGSTFTPMEHLSAADRNALAGAMMKIALGLSIAETSGRKRGTTTVKACPRCGAAYGDRVGGAVLVNAILHKPKCEIGNAVREANGILKTVWPGNTGS